MAIQPSPSHPLARDCRSHHASVLHWTAEPSMKILAFTAGAARMYCGSCLRDNTLAAEMRRQGHDIILMPIYTPTRTDEPNVSDPRVFMNGITVCLEQQSAFFRKTRWLLD